MKNESKEMIRDTRHLILRCISPSLRKQARQAIKQGDVLGFFGRADSMYSLFMFFMNVSFFSSVGLYEKALLVAWVNQKYTNGWGRVMKGLLLPICDRSKLLANCDPLPDGETFTVYRGVPTIENKFVHTDARGVSWTLDPKVARRFATPFGCAGKVYTTLINKSDIYAYMDESGRKGEKEILLVLDDDHPITVHEEILEEAE